MPKEKVIEGEAKDIPPKPEPENVPPKESSDFGSLGDSIRETVRRAVGETREAVNSVLQNRDNVVMVRVHADTLRYLDMLVDADITRSRSESAAFLINEGIKANTDLFGKIKEVTDQIDKLRTKLRETIKAETKEEGK